LPGTVEERPAVPPACGRLPLWTDPACAAPPPAAHGAGLAAQAAMAPVLGARREITYLDLPCRSVLNRCSNPHMPFGWTINPYRGCEFGCTYCYARYTHEYLGYDRWLDFETRIHVKSEAALRLEEEARGGRLRGRAIAIGTATDPYQPAERRYGVTRGILEVLARQDGIHLSITTKSDLVVRDLDLLREMARRGSLHVNFSITTLWPALARRLEPRAPTPLKRLAALRQLSEAGIECGVFAMPILPGLTDDDASLASLAEAAAAYGARYLLGQPLFLRESARRAFLPFLERQYPELVRGYRRAFARGSRLSPSYCARLAQRLARLRRRFGLADGPRQAASACGGPHPLPSAGPVAAAGTAPYAHAVRSLPVVSARAAPRSSAARAPHPPRPRTAGGTDQPSFPW